MDDNIKDYCTRKLNDVIVQITSTNFINNKDSNYDIAKAIYFCHGAMEALKDVIRHIDYIKKKDIEQ